MNAERLMKTNSVHHLEKKNDFRLREDGKKQEKAIKRIQSTIMVHVRLSKNGNMCKGRQKMENKQVGHKYLLLWKQVIQTSPDLKLN